MIETSLLFQESMAYSRTMFAESDIVKDGILLATGLPLTGGTITTDRESNTRYAASSVQVAWDRSETAEDPPLVADGRRVKIRMGVESIGYREAVELGTYLLYDFEDNYRGQYSLTLKGLETLVIADRFIRPRTPPYGVSTIATIRTLIQESVPDAEFVVLALYDRKITATAPWEKERWEACTALAESIDCEVFCGHDGRWYIQNTPDLTRMKPVAKVIAGPSGVVIEQKKTTSREKVRNAWMVFSSSSSEEIPPVYAFVYDSDPDSPTFYGNPVGALLAEQAAEMILTRFTNSQPLYPDWTWPGTPDLVKEHGPGLLAAYRASGSAGPLPLDWLSSYVTTYGDHTVTATTTPPQTLAARQFLARLNANLPLNEDWSWRGMPKEAATYNALHVAGWTAAYPLSSQMQAAQQIMWRLQSGQRVAEDMTWPGIPAWIEAWNDYWATEFNRANPGRDWTQPGTKNLARIYLGTHVYRSARAYLQAYINAHPPVTTSTFFVSTQEAAVARIIRDRLLAGRVVLSDWSWPGMPNSYRTYTDSLTARFRQAHRTLAMAWLTAYLAASTATGAALYTGGTFGKVVGFYASQFFTSADQCQAYGLRKLAASLAYTTQMSLSAAGPIPMLEAGDAVQVSDEKGNPLPDQLLNQTTLPLNGSAWNAECSATGTLEEEEA